MRQLSVLFVQVEVKLSQQHVGEPQQLYMSKLVSHVCYMREKTLISCKGKREEKATEANDTMWGSFKGCDYNYKIINISMTMATNSFKGQRREGWRGREKLSY